MDNMNLNWKSNSSQLYKILNTVFKFKSKAQLSKGVKTDSEIIYESYKNYNKKIEKFNQPKKCLTKVI